MIVNLENKTTEATLSFMIHFMAIANLWKANKFRRMPIDMKYFSFHIIDKSSSKQDIFKGNYVFYDKFQLIST